jgi:pimeloyl-ACP methyl ester carboxylesterase
VTDRGFTVAHERYINVGGFRTRFLEAGEKNNVPVILLHDGGFGASSDVSWGGIIDDLANDYHVIAPDLLGFGGTDKAVFLDRSPYSFRVAHIAALCEVLDIQSAHLIGNSFGGSLVLRVLESAGMAWRVRSVVSISGTGGPWRRPEGVEALAAFDGTLEGMRKLVELLIDEDFPGFDEQVEHRYENSLLPGHYEVMSAPRLRNPALEDKRAKIQDPYPATLRDCQTPILLVEGERDTLLEEGWTDKLAEVSTDIEVVRLDTKHSPNIDHPELLLDTLRTWFEKQEPADEHIETRMEH